MTFPDGVRYEITDGYPWVEFWDDENPNPEGAPFMRQDVHPDGTEWESIEQVQAWVDGVMNEWRNPPPPPPLSLTPDQEQALINAGWTPPTE